MPVTLSYRSTKRIAADFHSHPEYEIFYFHEGKSNYLIGDRIYTLSAGDLIIMHGLTLHCPKLNHRNAYIRSVIHFDPSYVQTINPLFPQTRLLEPFEELQNHRVNLQDEIKEEFESMLSKLDRLNRSTEEGKRQRFLLGFLDILFFILPLFRQPLRAANDHQSDKEKNVQRIISFLEQNYMLDLKLDQLERGLHLSKYYLSKIFKEVTGVTIFEFLYQRRINQAKVLFMMEKHKSVTEVCYQVGFKHLSHFSRMFKVKVGMTPEQYKRTGIAD